MDTSLNLNQNALSSAPVQAETAGTIASANSTPSPLFNVSTASETAGTIASTGSAPAAGGGFCANA